MLKKGKHSFSMLDKNSHRKYLSNLIHIFMLIDKTNNKAEYKLRTMA